MNMTDAEIKELSIKNGACQGDGIERAINVFSFDESGLIAFAKELEAITREKVLAELVKDSQPIGYICNAFDDGSTTLFEVKQESQFNIVYRNIPVYKMPPVPEDTARLNWIEKSLFGHSWNGVVDSGSRTHWTIWAGWRHVVADMEGCDFRGALDKAMLAAAKKGE